MRLKDAFNLFFFLFLLFSQRGDAVRPQVVSQRLWTQNSTVLNTLFEMAIMRMEFDQPMYVEGQPFLCGLAETSCVPTGCVPCDWSSQTVLIFDSHFFSRQISNSPAHLISLWSWEPDLTTAIPHNTTQPTDCANPNCCGPAEVGGEPFHQVEEWCTSSEDIPYTSLELGETSGTHQLSQGETSYFRFFVPSQLTCRSIQIIVRPYYGVPVIYASNLYPFPDSSNDDWRQGSNPVSFGMGSSSLTICPAVHSNYRLGTYSFGVEAVFDLAFDVEVVISSQFQPLVPPSVRISCTSVNNNEFLPGSPLNFCLEDGFTQTYDFPPIFENQVAQLILPIPEGCHTVSVAVTTSGLGTGQNYLYCLPRDADSLTDSQNALIARRNPGDNHLTFSACFDETTVVHCAVQSVVSGTAYMIFSTVSLPVRTPILAPTATSFTYQDSLGAASTALFGVAQPASCPDFFSSCYEWLASSTTDPLIFFPPSAEFSPFNSPIDIYASYTNTSLATPVDNILYLAVITRVGGTVHVPLSDLINQGSMVLLSVTNNQGEVPVLLDNGQDSSVRASPRDYLSHVAVSSFEFLNLTDFCTETSYTVLQDLVSEQIQVISGEGNSLVSVESSKYAIDVFNNAGAGSACIYAATLNMGLEMVNVSVVGQRYCRYDPIVQTELWENDPCCNLNLEPVSCCFPFEDSVETEEFIAPNATELTSCGVPECAVSFYEDLAFALNHLNDPLQGCSSGLTDTNALLEVFENEKLQAVVRKCLNEVGLGDNFEGVDCEQDSDCDNWEGICTLTRKCALPPTSEVEDNYVSCYINTMGSGLEDFLRRTVLPDSVSNAPKDSEEFYLAVKEAATTFDCVSEVDALQVQKRTRYEWDAARIQCKAEELGLTLPQDERAVLEACPVGYCLGQSCRQSYAQCYAECSARYTFFNASEPTCSEFPSCNVSDVGVCDGSTSYCVYCPPDNSRPCIRTPITDQATCEQRVACVLPDGQVVFDLTEEQCSSTSRKPRCSTDCFGPGCQSFSGLSGMCRVDVDSEPTCQNVAKTFSVTTLWFDKSICVLPETQFELECDEFEQDTTIPTSWIDCNEIALSECGNPTDSSQRYLSCYVSDWHQCLTQEECQDSGSCSDRTWTRVVRSNGYPFELQTGACFSSGFNDLSGEIPACHSFMDRPGIGCRDPTILSEMDCIPFSIEMGTEWWWRQWLTPATTQENCLQQQDARFGCLLPGPEQQLLWLNSSECECRGGEPQNAWEWESGVWLSNGVSRSLAWLPATPESEFVWASHLSFLVMEDWVLESVEEQFLFGLQSEVICQNNFITSSLTHLVCDCLHGENETDHDEHDCYLINEDRENLIGISAVCAGELSFIKGPSARVTFDEESISADCSFVNLSMVNKAWFDAVPSDVAISFRFEDHRERQTVRNKDDANVGTLVGDGAVLSYSNTTALGVFHICMRISVDYDLDPEKDSRDFGYSNADDNVIIPLGLTTLTQDLSNNLEFWCSDVDYSNVPTKDGAIRLYPIVRLNDYKDEEASYVSEKTEGLMYTLGALYIIDLLLFVFFLVATLRSVGGSGKGQLALLVPLSVIFSVLCVFRICFMFMYPRGVFYEESLSEFVVFEIPTFLLFSIVIISIGFWKRLSSRTKFFATKELSHYILIGIFFVWALWVVITVVYAEVILDESSGDSPCPGRVPDSNDELEENTRTLAIVYQTIIISVTLILAVVFCFYTYKLFSLSKNVSRAKQFILAIGGLIVVSFLFRCIFFIIILAADFTSSVYMFIVLFFTEVLMMTLVGLQFNSKFMAAITATSKTSGSVTQGLTSGDEVTPRKFDD